MDSSEVENVPNSASKLSIGEAKEAVKSLIKGRLEGKSVPPIMLWGPPGIGKTEITNQAAQELGVDIETLILSQHDEVDLMGLPHETNHTVEWTRPTFLPEKGKGILHLDELTQARPSVMNPAQQLVCERRAGPHKLGEGWYIVSSANRLSDRALTNQIGTAMANRFLNYEVETTLDDWKKWAYSSGIEPVVIAFHEYHKGKLLFQFDPERMETVRGFPTPRTWEYVSDLLHLGMDSVKALAGPVGEGAAREFAAFERLQGDLPDIDEIFGGKNLVPERPEILHTVVSSVSSTVLQNLDDLSYAKRAIEYALELPPEFATLLGKNILRKDLEKEKIDEMTATESWTKYAEEYKEAIIPELAAFEEGHE